MLRRENKTYKNCEIYVTFNDVIDVLTYRCKEITLIFDVIADAKQVDTYGSSELESPNGSFLFCVFVFLFSYLSK